MPFLELEFHTNTLVKLLISFKYTRIPLQSPTLYVSSSHNTFASVGNIQCIRSPVTLTSHSHAIEKHNNNNNNNDTTKQKPIDSARELQKYAQVSTLSHLTSHPTTQISLHMKIQIHSTILFMNCYRDMRCVYKICGRVWIHRMMKLCLVKSLVSARARALASCTGYDGTYVISQSVEANHFWYTRQRVIQNNVLK